MKDVAAHVGVSRQLVSMVFRDMPGPNPDTRERIYQAARDLGYRPDTAARVLRRNRSHHLGVLFTLRHPFDAELVEYIYPAARDLGYDISLGAMAPTRDERAAIDELLSSPSEALILIGSELGAEQLAGVAESVPVVEISRRHAGLANVDVVRTADERGVRQAADYLVGLGHQDIAHVDGGTMPGAAERRRGYRAAMRRHGLADHIRILPGDYTEESGARAAQEFLSNGPLPTAVIAGNDRCALGLLDTFVRMKVDVPADISVVGYDDSSLAQLSFIDLTSVRQDAAQLARLAVEAAVERLDDGRTTPKDIALKPALIIRGTTGPPR